MKIGESLVAIFLLFISVVSVAQASTTNEKTSGPTHHRSLNSHVAIADTAEMPDEHREESLHKKLQVTD